MHRTKYADVDCRVSISDASCFLNVADTELNDVWALRGPPAFAAGSSSPFAWNRARSTADDDCENNATESGSSLSLFLTRNSAAL